MRNFIAVLALGCFVAVRAEEMPPAISAPACIELRDQFDAPQKLAFPTTNIALLTIADKKGSEQVDAWIAALKPRYAGRIDIRGLADCGEAPGFLRIRIRKKFQQAHTYPVMMDWSGKVCAQFNYVPGRANLFVIDQHGRIAGRFAGAATTTNLSALSALLDAALSVRVNSSSAPLSRPPTTDMP